MKTNIHPQYRADAIITCSSCGATYEIGTVAENTVVATCAKCHPFYTGEQQVMLDTANKISSFKNRMSKADDLKKKKEEIEKRRAEREKSKIGVIGSNNEPRLSLRDLLKASQK